MAQLGKKTWLIPDMYWPEQTVDGSYYVSHEAICVLNTSEKDCEILITYYFEDSDPVQIAPILCKAKRTNHLRMDRINPKNGFAKGTPYAAVINSSIPVVVQYTRVDCTQEANSIMTTIAYPIDEEK